MLKLYFKQTNTNGIYPHNEHLNSDAGFDLYSTEDFILYPNQQKLIKIGIAVQGDFVDPEDRKKWTIKFKIEGCSGNASKLGIFPIGGVIDESYKGEIGVVLCNITSEPIKVNAIKENGKPSKIAQLIPTLIPKISEINCLKVDEDFPEGLNVTDRGTNGFGSTGVAGV